MLESESLVGATIRLVFPNNGGSAQVDMLIIAERGEPETWNRFRSILTKGKDPFAHIALAIPEQIIEL